MRSCAEHPTVVYFFRPKKQILVLTLVIRIYFVYALSQSIVRAFGLKWFGTMRLGIEIHLKPLCKRSFAIEFVRGVCDTVIFPAVCSKDLYRGKVIVHLRLRNEKAEMHIYVADLFILVALLKALGSFLFNACGITNASVLISINIKHASGILFLTLRMYLNWECTLYVSYKTCGMCP